MLRGNGGAPIFADDRDRYRLFLFLQEVVERLGCHVYAYCLMDNHLHLGVQVGSVPLSKIMQILASRYTRWSNWRQQKTGHLFQGRYKAILVEEDAYLLQLIAYLHLNPVRAGMTTGAEDYRWSSHRAYLGREVVPWLWSAPVLGQLSANGAEARCLFADFVNKEEGRGHRREFHGAGEQDPRICGEETFVAEVLEQADEKFVVRPDLAATVACVTEYFGTELETLRAAGQNRHRSQIRAFAAWAVSGFSSSTLSALGALLARDVSSLSSAVHRLDQRCSWNDDLARVKRELAAKLTNLQA